MSCDPAGKAGVHNDYTAITIVGVQKQALYVLQVARGHWTVMPMREQIIGLAAQWQVDLVLVEDTSSGMSLACAPLRSVTTTMPCHGRWREHTGLRE